MIDWRHWHNEPYLVGGIICLGWLYAVTTGPLRGRFSPSEPFPRHHAIRFYCSLAIFYLAVGSPLDQMGERFLLSAHMVQHQLLIYGAAVLFLLGIPSWLIAPITDRPGFRWIGRRVFHPTACGMIFAVTLTGWHAPALYDWALRNKSVHILEHLMFFGSALFYWWPILSPSKAFPPANYAVQMVYLVGITIAMTPVFAFIAFSDNVLYPTYDFAPRLVSTLSPIEDQLLGAVIMKLGGLIVTATALFIAFYRWYQASERKARAA